MLYFAYVNLIKTVLLIRLFLFISSTLWVQVFHAKMEKNLNYLPNAQNKFQVISSNSQNDIMRFCTEYWNSPTVYNLYICRADS